MTAYSARFPLELKPEQVTLLLAGCSAALSQRQVVGYSPTLRLSAVGHAGRIEQELEVLHGDEARILTTLRSQLPSLHLDEIEFETLSRPTMVVELRLTNRHRPLRTDRAGAISAAVLGALASAGSSERIELRWLIGGARTPQPARRLARQPSARGVPWPGPHPSEWHTSADEFQAEKRKQSEPLLVATARIAVWGTDRRRGRQLLRHLLQALSAVNAPGVRLATRVLPQRWVGHRFLNDATPRFEWPLLLNAAELTSLIGWPIGAPQVPGLALGSTRQLAPSRQLSRDPREGAVLADATFPGHERPVVLRHHDRLMHLHIVGPTGSGKSVLLEHIGASDMAHGHGLIILDPRGDLIDALADQVPSWRHDDVIVFDPSDDRPVGFNPLRRPNRADHLVVDQLDHLFRRLFGSGNYGPRSSDINRASLLTLLAASRASQQYTLAELPLLLTSAGFRQQLLAHVTDPALNDFWQWFTGLGQAQASVIAPLLNKYRALLLSRPVRDVLAQADPGWSLDDVIAQRKILLVRLSAGEIGAEAAQLLGSMLIAGIYEAAQARTRLAPEQRRPVMLVVDEWQNFLRIAQSLEDMLAQARGLGLGLTLANQQLGQLSNSMQAEVLANARNRIIFQTTAKDARTLASHLPGMAPEDLQHLGPYEVAMHLAVGSGHVPPTIGRTRPPADPTGTSRYIKVRSRERYGRARSDIAAELAERWAQATPSSDYAIGELPLDDDDDGGEQ